MKKTECYTYFSIKGEFDPDEITSILGIQPVKTFRSGEPRYYMKDGRKIDTGHMYSCSCWAGCRCDEYDVIIKGNDIINSETIQDLFNVVKKQVH